MCPVDNNGQFTAAIPEYQGIFVKEVDRDIIRRLKGGGHLFRQATIHHRYPFCWRSDTPLIYKAVRTWFVAVEKIKEMLVSVNKQTHWMPEHLKEGRFGKWLEGARDWAISRNRYWGDAYSSLEGRRRGVSGDWFCGGFREGNRGLPTQLECPAELAVGLAALARDGGPRTVLNPAPGEDPLPPGALATFDIITPNEGELATLAASLGLADAPTEVLACELVDRGVPGRGGDARGERRAVGIGGVADSGSVYEFSTNGGSFRLATGFGQLHGLATDKNGNVYAADSSNCTIWRINSAGQFTDFAGNGTCGYFGDGSSSVYWMFDGPLGLAIDGAGNVFIADSNNQCIREVMANGTLSTVTGLTGKPSAVAVDAQGTLYITLLNGSLADKAPRPVRLVHRRPKWSGIRRRRRTSLQCTTQLSIRHCRRQFGQPFHRRLREICGSARSATEKSKRSPAAGRHVLWCCSTLGSDPARRRRPR